MINLLYVYLIVLYICLPGLLNKAGYNFFLGLIPIYNVYLPFILADAYSKGKVVSILGLILPIIIFPYLAYAPSAIYTYSTPVN